MSRWPCASNEFVPNKTKPNKIKYSTNHFCINYSKAFHVCFGGVGWEKAEPMCISCHKPCAQLGFRLYNVAFSGWNPLHIWPPNPNFTRLCKRVGFGAFRSTLIVNFSWTNFESEVGHVLGILIQGKCVSFRGKKMGVKCLLDFRMITFEERGANDNVVFYHFVKYIWPAKFIW